MIFKKISLKYIGLITAIIIFLLSSGVVAVKYQVWDLKSPNLKQAATGADPVPSGPIVPAEQLIKLPDNTCPDGYDGRYFTLKGQKIDADDNQTDWINKNCKDVSRENAAKPQEEVKETVTSEQPSKDPILMSPYENDSEIGDVWVYCKTLGNGCPRSDVHTGLDFITNKNLAAIRSVVTGMVTKVELYENSYPNPNNPTYQVNVEMKYDSVYSVGYSFEPMTHNKADAEYQLSLMKIKPGVTVQQSWRIGNLLLKGENSHIHLDLYKNGEPICPEKYFSETALKTVMQGIQKKYPGRKMCY